jgi:lipoprotein-releasing system permease protein
LSLHNKHEADGNKEVDYSIFGRLQIDVLNVSIYIARKIQKAQNTKGSIVGPVIAAATLAIALGMILMIISLSTGLGLKRAISDKIVGFTGHLTITNYDLNDSYEQQPISMDSISVDELQSRDAIVHMHAFGTKAGILKGKEDFEGVVLKGVAHDYDWQFFAANIREGRIPKLAADERNDSIIVSAVLANRLRLSLYDTVQMYFIQAPPRPPRIRRFYICGIYGTGLEDFDKTYLLGDLYHVQRLNRWRTDQVGGYEVLLQKFDEVEETTTQLRAELPYHLNARSVRSQNEQLFQWLDLFDLNIYLIITIMVVVAVINMISALLILILDRTNMIGLLKALGLANWPLMRIFLYQSANIIFRGLIWGILIGIGVCLLQQQFGIIKLDPETYYVTQAPIVMDVGLLLLLNIGVIATCLLTLVIPALLVSRISPVKALRYE